MVPDQAMRTRILPVYLSDVSTSKKSRGSAVTPDPIISFLFLFIFLLKRLPFAFGLTFLIHFSFEQLDRVS